MSVGPSGAPEAAVWTSCHCCRQRLCGGNLLQDLPAVCRVQPPPETDPPEPAAGPPHRYTHLSLLQDGPQIALCAVCVCLMCCVCVQRRARPPSSPGWSTVTRFVWRSPRLPFLEWSCTLRTTWPVCASEERWSKSTEDISANWSVLLQYYCSTLSTDRDYWYQWRGAELDLRKLLHAV